MPWFPFWRLGKRVVGNFRWAELAILRRQVGAPDFAIMELGGGDWRGVFLTSYPPDVRPEGPFCCSCRQPEGLEGFESWAYREAERKSSKQRSQVVWHDDNYIQKMEAIDNEVRKTDFAERRLFRNWGF